MGLHIKDIFKLMETFIEARDMLAGDMELHEAEYGKVRKDAPIKRLVDKMSIIIKESHEEQEKNIWVINNCSRRDIK